ncbi:rhomboid domain-containing protein 3 isoform X2 [Rhineura floridana]|uniref:rhomboid domain-containing protein 3 isoform X2 n=1 Tax=Rhineura floridana TaxID=261503 RepID=UPI002AC84FAB|nr:rhomboid domain-containing protein 3 isoform X2 [Rhineura floridana]XP_061458907.1 rhomboid domain-containing protein 3 isoform X2 [Rhineura floridana]XP_061458908.1 rhomboid domain-containing protein 3 isoform X2 [Rhineura floridana]XP_061458909.1 rhomboid domain-containing protein 3 isoform X2 [Rhineura floridana]XP_061458910.1 rhomboid domain-containing protein 3 isoform X2 [Rhineura floridana]
MPIKRILTRRWGLPEPPFASATLMVLLCLFWLMGVGESLALTPTLLLTSPFQAYRLLTYCLYPTEAPLFFFSLLLFPLLGWRQELHWGTLRYLHALALGAIISALLYLLLTGLAGAQPGSAVGGYTPVHLALLGWHQRHQRQVGSWRCTFLALQAGLLLGVTQMLSPNSPFLLHLSGLLTGLAFWAGTFSPLELSERRLERLHEGVICRILRVRGPFLHFVRSPASEILPTSDPAARRERIPLSPEFHAQTLFPRDFPTEPLPSASPPAFYWSEKRVGLGQECRLLLASSPLPPFSAHGGASDVPFSTLREPLTDEELLQAGIQASLQDMTEEEVKLSKSSVSSLRLQQLQKMGFPTEQAVVALAASGHVEGAVSLLIGGHVGDKAMVTADSRSAHR